MSLGKKVFSSALLLLIRKIWGNVLNLVVMAFLARILSRADFGLLAISSVFLGIINTVATSGIADYIVYYDGDDRQQRINAAFWLNLLLTMAVVVIIVVVGPFWAAFYNDGRIYTLLLLLAIPFFFEMCSTIPKAILRKDLDYKAIVFYSGISMTLISIGKLVSAWAGLGMYSLVVPQAIVSPFLMLAFFFKTQWRPFGNLGLTYFKDIFNYTKHIIGGRVLTRLVNDGDNLIVGKFIGMEGLGIYALAFQLANLVTTNVVFLVNDIFLPLFNKVKGDMDRLKQLYSRMILFLSFISFPLIASLMVSAEAIVYFIYGEKWLDAVLPFQILCVFALGRSISSPSSALYNAVGRPDIGFKFTSYFTPLFLASVFLGSYYGVVGVALVTTLVRVGGSIVSLHLALNLIQLRLKDIYQILKGNLIATALVMILFSWTCIKPFPSKWIILLIIIPVVLYVHLLLQRIFFKSELISFFDDLENYLPVKNVHSLIRRFFFLSA